MKVVAVPQLMDNYAYLVIDEATGQAGVVDCAEAEPVLQAAAREQATLTAILPTHHHYDHVGGNEDLLRTHPGLTVYGVDERIPGLTQRVQDGDRLTLGSLSAQVIFIPAHTTGHIAYYFAAARAVFTGDTLFAGGCGRLFEGDAAMMIRSLSKLLVLPDDTRVYFGHEYTEKNLRFALTLEPTNAALREARLVGGPDARRRHRDADQHRLEKATNPFLRWTSPELRATLRQQFPDLPMTDVDVFAKTRALKDTY
ncbi:MAG: hydroxyacylglutathione hydrolase [Candidatus Binatia bacterium]